MSIHAIHRLVPKWPVSRSRSPSWHAAEVFAARDNSDGLTKKREYQNLILYRIDTKANEDAGSTLATGLNGPKSRVYFIPPTNG